MAEKKKRLRPTFDPLDLPPIPEDFAENLVSQTPPSTDLSDSVDLNPPSGNPTTNLTSDKTIDELFKLEQQYPAVKDTTDSKTSLDYSTPPQRETGFWNITDSEISQDYPTPQQGKTKLTHTAIESMGTNSTESLQDRVNRWLTDEMFKKSFLTNDMFKKKLEARELPLCEPKRRNETKEKYQDRKTEFIKKQLENGNIFQLTATEYSKVFGRPIPYEGITNTDADILLSTYSSSELGFKESALGSFNSVSPKDEALESLTATATITMRTVAGRSLFDANQGNTSKQPDLINELLKQNFAKDRSEAEDLIQRYPDKSAEDIAKIQALGDFNLTSPKVEIPSPLNSKPGSAVAGFVSGAATAANQQANTEDVGDNAGLLPGLNIIRALSDVNRSNASEQPDLINELINQNFAKNLEEAEELIQRFPSKSSAEIAVAQDLGDFNLSSPNPDTAPQISAPDQPRPFLLPKPLEKNNSYDSYSSASLSPAASNNTYGDRINMYSGGSSLTFAGDIGGGNDPNEIESPSATPSEEANRRGSDSSFSRDGDVQGDSATSRVSKFAKNLNKLKPKKRDSFVKALTSCLRNSDSSKGRS